MYLNTSLGWALYEVIKLCNVSSLLKQHIPFAAVKLYFSGLGGERTKVDDIVGNNFRSEKDSILKTKNYKSCISVIY